MSVSFSIHRRTWDLIPWIVNGTAEAQERAAVEPHLSECELCRNELQLQRELCAAIAAPLAEPVGEEAAEQGWQRLRERLQGESVPEAEAHPASVALSRTPRGQWGVAWAAAATLEAVALGALGMALWSKGPPSQPAAQLPAYRTLSAASAIPAAATIRVVLAPSTTLAQMQALLEHSDLQVVAGPSAEGVWSLAPSSASGRAATEAALKSLRADPRVRFAEPVEMAR